LVALSIAIIWAPKNAAIDSIVIKSEGRVIEPRLFDVEGGQIPRWEYQYVHDNEPWIQHRYGLPLDPHRTYLVTAQAPESMWPQIDEAVRGVVHSFQPLGGA